MERAHQARRVAALAIVVLDRASTPGEIERRILRETSEPRVIVASKSDLPAAWARADLGCDSKSPIEVSALSGDGLGALREAIVTSLLDGEALRDAPIISNVRHVGLVESAVAATTRAAEALAAGATEELVLTDLAAARQALEEITGTRTSDDLLHHIFARFCVGK